MPSRANDTILVFYLISFHATISLTKELYRWYYNHVSGRGWLLNPAPAAKVSLSCHVWQDGGLSGRESLIAFLFVVISIDGGSAAII
jgi:hypothetical protein